MPRPNLYAAVHVACPDAGAEAVERVVGDLHGLVFVFEGGDGDDGPEDLLLEDAHLVVALEDGRLDVEAVLEVAVERGALAAGEDLGAFLPADVEVGEDLFDLLGGGLRADHGGAVERVALLDGFDAARGPSP